MDGFSARASDHATTASGVARTTVLTIVLFILSVILLALVRSKKSARDREANPAYGGNRRAVEISLRVFVRGAFNPSLAFAGDRAWLSVRHSPSRDENGSVRIAYGSVSSLHLLPLKTSPSLHGLMDLRLFWHGGRLLGVAHRLSASPKQNCRMCLVDVAEATWADLVCDKLADSCQKNWIPLSSEGELYFLTCLEPLQIVRCDAPLFTGPWPRDLPCSVVYGADAPIQDVQERGSSAATLMKDGRWLVATHRRIRKDPPGYTHGVAMLQPRFPWKVIARSPPLFFRGRKCRSEMGA